MLKELYAQDEGGNSTFSRMEAEIVFNKTVEGHKPVTDSSLTHGDLRRIYSLLVALRVTDCNSQCYLKLI